MGFNRRKMEDQRRQAAEKSVDVEIPLSWLTQIGPD